MYIDKDIKDVPMHSRWRHFDVLGRPRIHELISSWMGVDKVEQCRRLIDLFVVSVLLDAGAGDIWYVAMTVSNDSFIGNMRLRERQWEDRKD
jgi:hypothetical protein